MIPVMEDAVVDACSSKTGNWKQELVLPVVATVHATGQDNWNSGEETRDGLLLL